LKDGHTPQAYLSLALSRNKDGDGETFALLYLPR
jgi:hypothetical protein